MRKPHRPIVWALTIAWMLVTSLNLGPRRAVGQPAAAGLAPFALDATWPLPAAPARPLDLALDPAGRLYAVDAGHHSVKVFDPDGRLVAEWAYAPDEELLAPQAVEVDGPRSLVHVLWASYGLSDAGLTFQGLRLDTRRLDGSPTRPLRALSGIGPADDMAFLAGSNELLLWADGQIRRVRADSTWLVGSFAAPAGSGLGRLAALADGRLALFRAGAERVDLVTPEGIPAGRLDLEGLRAVAAAGLPSGGVGLLLGGSDPNDPSALGYLEFDAQGRRGAGLTLARIGMPAIAAFGWPWSLAVGADGMALTAGSSQYQTLRFDGAGVRRFGLAGGPVQEQQVVTPVDRAQARPLNLAADGAGGLVVLDGVDDRWLAFSPAGQAQVLTAAPAGAVDFGLGEGMTAFVSTEAGELLRMPLAADGPPLWRIPCRCDLGGRIAANPVAVYVSQPRESAVAVYSAEDGLRLRPYLLPGSGGLWPMDLATGEGGRLFTADQVQGLVQAWRRAEAPDGLWQAGLLAGPRRLAVGIWDGREVVAALLADGAVELHDALGGKLLARWRPEVDGKELAISDLALGRDGTVYLGDAEAQAIRVYAPSIGLPNTAEPPAEPSPTATPSQLACTLRGDRIARPAEVVLGSTAAVTLSLAADCPNSSRVLGADLVLVLDRSSSMRGAKLSAAADAARSFVELLDLRYHRAAIVSFSSEARLDQALGTDAGALIDALRDLAAGGETNMAAAVTAARDHLDSEGRAEALPVVILLTDGQVGGASDPRPVAAQARAAGIVIYTIGLGTDAARALMQDIAGDPSRVFMAPSPPELYPIYRQILRQVLSSLAGAMVLTEPMVGGLDLLPGSSRPGALEADDRLQWARTLLPRTGISLSYEVLAVAPGCRPLSTQSRAEYTDADGVRRSFSFPVPTVCVLTPTPTPSPSATPTPSPSPSATATGVPRPLFLPLLNGCRQAANPVDVVLLLDSSVSMSGAKLDQAKEAARSFLAMLDLRRDQAAVIGFNNAPILAAGLGQDLGGLQGAVDRLSVGSGTRIDRAIQAAVAELLGPRRRAGNQGVIVLLSDGAHSGTSADLRRASAEARSLGALIYAIGFGPDADAAELAAIAGPDRSFLAGDGAALKRIYREIATALPCR